MRKTDDNIAKIVTGIMKYAWRGGMRGRERVHEVHM